MNDTILTIGSFDGLHRGHQEVIRRVVTTAEAFQLKSVVITFEPHPKQILDPQGERFELLMSVDKKLQLLDLVGVDITLVIPFDLEFARMSAHSFLENIVVQYFDPQKIIIGYDHRFGHDRRGDSEFLENFAQTGSFDVEVVPGVKDQDEMLTSTRIRALIREGHIRRASFELGWVFGFDATVVRGAGRGHSLSFPTANFVPRNPKQLVPKRGVYLARSIVGKRCLYGMCNIGYRPTFGEDAFVMEIHFLEDQDIQDLYQESIEVQFLERIRDEKRFATAASLVEQLEQDKAYCLGRINIYREEEPCL